MTSARKQRLIDLDHRRLWHPFTQMQGWSAEDPLIVSGGEGNELIDIDGRRYLDGVSSLWCNVHGHRHPKIDQAVRDQLGRIAHSTLLGLAQDTSIEFADALVRRLPDGLSRIFYSDNGSTAAEVAIKMAYSYHRLRGRKNRNKYITFEGAYHGDTLGSVSVGAIELFHEQFRPLLFPTHQLPYPFVRRAPWTKADEPDPKALMAEVERRVAEIAPDAVAIVIEPLIQGAAGMKTAPAGFLKLLRNLADEHGLLLIADEVATGFGRTGTMFACEQEGVTPDLLAMAKGISGGYLPIAATAATEEVYDAFLGAYEEFKTFFHGHTYTGNALACAAGLASLEVFDEEGTLDALSGKIERFTQGLAAVAELPHVAGIRQAGVMIGIELVADTATGEGYAPRRRIGHQVCMKARERDVIIRPLSDVIILNPPLSITPSQIDHLLETVHWSIEQITQGRDQDQGDDAP